MCLQCEKLVLVFCGNAWFHKKKHPPIFAKIHCSCDKVYQKQEVRFLLYILGQIVT